MDDVNRLGTDQEAGGYGALRPEVANAGHLPGVLGGMGPEATIELMRRVHDLVPAQRDQDHVPLLVFNNTQIPSRFNAAVGKGPSPLPALIRTARALAAAGATSISIPCNSAHAYLAEVRAAVEIPVISLFDLVQRELQGLRVSRVGVLATTSTAQLGIFDMSLNHVGVVYPNDHHQVQVMDLIEEIKSSSSAKCHPGPLNSAILELTREGADAVILGCTELSLLRPRINTEVNVVDPLALLAQHIVTSVEPRPN